MRNFDLSPLYRSTVGFDRFGSMLDQLMSGDTPAPSYPPYNIEKTGEDAYRISIAVAGFGEGDLNIVGGIFKGTVKNIEPGLKAMFVDIGLDKNAAVTFVF